MATSTLRWQSWPPYGNASDHGTWARAQVSLRPFLPPDTTHGYVFSFWGKAEPTNPNNEAMPKVVFQDADDAYTPLKQVCGYPHPHPNPNVHAAQVGVWIPSP